MSIRIYFLALVIALTSLAGAQNITGNSLTLSPVLTVGTLPSAATNKGRIFPISDGLNPTDCTVGGGTNHVWCWSNGTIYAVPFGISYPGAGIPNFTGSAWGTSYTVGGVSGDIPKVGASSIVSAGFLGADSGGNLIPVAGGNTTSYSGTGTAYSAIVSCYNQTFPYAAFTAASPTQSLAVFSVGAYWHAQGFIVAENSTVAGSLTSGTFQVNEGLTQYLSGGSATGATSQLLTAPPFTGTNAFAIGPITGTANTASGSYWTGNTSGAKWTQTAGPAVFTTETGITALTATIQGASGTNFTLPTGMIGATSGGYASYDGGFFSAASTENGTQSLYVLLSVANASPGNLGTGSASKFTSGAVTVKACGVTIQ